MEAFRFRKDLSLKLLCFLLPGLAAVLSILWLAPAQPARADGGGFPTRTPTRTLIPFLPTVTPTSPDELLLVFPPTATTTLTTDLFGEQAQPPAGQAIPEAGIPASAQPFSLLSCWPFALIFLLLLVVGVWYISSRRQSTT